MAGGAGERFWPLSRQSYPKQLLKIAGDTSMLRAAIQRVNPLVPADRVFVVTGPAIADAIRRDTSGLLAPEQVLTEPEPRNTAACLALAAAFAEARFGGADVSMAVLTADHFIPDAELFRDHCRRAFEHAESADDLVTFGMVPDRPETGYGYIEIGEPVSPDASIYRVASFREKPNPDMAAEFLASGRFLWNSGMFVWRAGVLREAFRLHLPAVESRMDAMAAAFRMDAPADRAAGLTEAFRGIEKISIDVGVLERARNVVALKATFGWDDIGTWGSLRRLMDRDRDGNVVFGHGATVGCRDTTVYNVERAPAATGDNSSGCGGGGGTSTAPPPRLVIGFGLRDVVIVQTADAVLVLPADKVQGVKDVTAHLRAHGLTDYL